jgi:hypothetical protein
VSIPIIYVFDGFTKPQNSSLENVPNNIEDSQPILEISEELGESLKKFGIDNADLRTRVSDFSEKPQIPYVPGFSTENWQEIRIGNRLIAIPSTQEIADQELVAEVKIVARTIDLLEPFTRIHRALDEACSVA